MTPDKRGVKPNDMTNASSACRTTPPPVLVYNVEQIAAMLQLSERHIWRLIKTEELPTIKLGGRRVIPVRTFHCWFERISAIPTPDTALEADAVPQADEP